MQNIPEVKLGLIAVSRDCFPIALSEKRRAAIVKTCGGNIYECPVTVENETDMLKAVEDVKAAGCNALVVFLGNFGPETPETLIAKYFDGPCMFVAAAEGDGDLINGRGDAYCGMLNCSYNLGMRHLPGYIPEYPVGTAEDIGKMIKEFYPIARAVIGNPEILILDDSFSALDFATDAALRQALRNLPYRPTVFIVSQRAASLLHADKILVLDDGQMVGMGRHEELLRSCVVYAEIYASQFRREDDLSVGIGKEGDSYAGKE